jgi:hypothetical protein
MLVTERMQALGNHAKSSRQSPVKERKYAKADESAAKQDVIDDTILEDGATHESAVAVLVDDVTPHIVVHQSGKGGAVAEIASNEDAGDDVTHAKAVQEDDEAKHAIIHEWENWSALHSDELSDPNVAEYFFRHLKQKKTHLLNFDLPNEWDIVRALIAPPAAIQS